MDRITERTGIPLGWVIGLFSTGISITIIGTIFVASVNFRLSRIEEKLGIEPYQVALMQAAQAKQK